MGVVASMMVAKGNTPAPVRMISRLRDQQVEPTLTSRIDPLVSSRRRHPMVFQTHSRRLLAVFGSALMASTLSCGSRHQPQNQVMQRSEDVIASGSSPTVMDSVPGDAIL